MKTHLKQDSRDIHVLDHFAAPLIIPDEMEFDRGLTNIIEQPGEVDCTAISAVDVGTDQTGDTYDIADQWINTPHTAQGANPRDSMATMIRRGLKSLTTGLQDTRWKSYMRADGDSGDYAQTTQMSMLATNSSTTVASNYYAEWNMTPEDGVLPPGKKRISGHDYKISGWRTTPTGLQFHVKFWTGGFKWMPKEVYNIEMAMYGTGAYIPTTTTAQGQVISFIQTIIDWAINQCLAIQRQIIQLKTQPMFDTIPAPIQNTIPANQPSQPQYIWDTKEDIRHSIRMIGDTYSMSVIEKDLLCDICNCESGFNIQAKLVNSPDSIDRGLFQWNNKYHPEITDDIAYDPVQATKLAIHAILDGKAMEFWSASAHCWNVGGKYNSLIS